MFKEKLARGATVLRPLLVGVKYGSAGDKTTLLTIGVLGGNENTEYLVLSTSAAAIVARSVEIAAVMVSQPCYADRGKVQVSHEREQVKYYPCDKGWARIHRW